MKSLSFVIEIVDENIKRSDEDIYTNETMGIFKNKNKNYGNYTKNI